MAASLQGGLGENPSDSSSAVATATAGSDRQAALSPGFVSFTDNNDGTGARALSSQSGDAGTKDPKLSASDGNDTPTQQMSVAMTEPAASRLEAQGSGIQTSLQSSNFSSETFLSEGISQPMGVTFLPDGRMLIIQKTGKIWITNPDDGTNRKQEYMDISGQVNTGGERGLLDITLDPNFSQNKHVYLLYSNSNEKKNRIARFTHQENSGGLNSSADPSSEFLVWEETKQWTSCCHEGGGLDFGPEGKLWTTMGDDFNGDVADDLSQSDGKVIRVNKDGTIPQDNPYADDGDPNTLGEIWSYGERNPFRAEWDLQSEQFFIGNVGGNNSPDFEEVNVVTLDDAGANYGWPDCEGTSKSNEDAPCDISQKKPLYSYSHSVGNSITGGEVYRGEQFPEKFQGAYFFGDYGKNWIKYMTFDSNGDVANVSMFEDQAPNVNSITVGPEGALYWTNIGATGPDSGAVSEGNVFKITFTGNKAPQINSVSVNLTSASSAPQTVAFDVSATDPENDSLTYEWTFGDGSTGSGVSPSHTYSSSGVYAAYVEVSDGTRTIKSEQLTITIGQPPSVTIESPQDGKLFRAGDTISFSASANDPETGELSSDSISWNVEFDHDPPNGADHDHPIKSLQGASGSFTVPTSGHDYTTDTSYTLTAAATDPDGLSASKSVTIEPEKVDVTLDTEPDGLEASIDGVPVKDGIVLDTLIDFQHAVSAPQTQCLNGREYEFQNWSDGGARSHDYTVPDSDTTLTATYKDVGECSLPVRGLVAQYESDQGLATDNGEVTGWADQSGQDNDLTAAGDPTVANSPTGQQAVSFDGDGDKLERTATLNGLPSGNSDRSVFLVAKYESGGYGGFAFGDTSSDEAFGTSVDPAGNLMVQAWGGNNDVISDVAGTGQGWLVQSAVLNSSQVTHYKNGDQIDQFPHSYATDLQQMVLGAELDSDPFLDMEVAAAYVYNRSLSDAERQQVYQHLKTKYLGNQPPTASNDVATVDTGNSTTIDVLANDDDPEESLNISSVSIENGPSHGTATVHANGSITYTHDGSDTTSDSFVYSVTDDQGASDTATVSVSVRSASVPFQTGLVAYYAADSSVTAATNDVITGWPDLSGQGNDLTDISGDPTLEGNALNGKPVVSFEKDDFAQRTQTLNGLPSGNSDRTVILVAKYESDGFGGFGFGKTADNQTFATIVDPKGNLMIQAWSSTRDKSSGVAGTGAGWLVQSAVLNSSQVTHYKNGTQIDLFTNNYNTTLEKMIVGANLNAPGGDARLVDMKVAEAMIYDQALSDTEHQQVQNYLQEKYFGVTNQAPTAEDDSASVTADQSVTIDVLANDIPEEALNASSVTITSQPSTGTATVNADGTISYTAPSGASGDVIFTYSVADDEGATDTATVTIAVSELPVASGLVTHFAAGEGVSTSGGAVTGWADQSGQGNDLTAAGNPTVASTPSGQPAISFDGDGDKLERTATLNGLPSGNSDRSVFLVAKYESGGYGGFAFGDTSPDEAFGTSVDPPGNLMVQAWGQDNDVISDVAGTGQGWLVQSAVLNSSQVTHYKNGTQIDQFTHSYSTDLQQMVLGAELDSDPFLDMEAAAVVVYDRALSDTEHQQIYQHLQNKYLNKSDTNQVTTPEAVASQQSPEDKINLTEIQTAINWWATNEEVPGTGGKTIDLKGIQTLINKWATSATVGDGGDGGGGNTLPTAEDDSASVTAGQSVTVAVLDNDTDDGTLNTASVTIVSQPTNGTVSVNASTGGITYTHDGSASTSDSFTYSVADDDGATDTATVSITINQPTDSQPPVTSGLVAQYESNQGVSTSGGAVTGWADQSGQDNDLTAAGDPTVANSPTGQQAVSFDGDGDKLERTATLKGFPSGSENRTIVYAVNYQSTGWGGFTWGEVDGNRANKVFGLGVTAPKAGNGHLMVQGWGSANDFTTDVAGKTDGWMVQAAVVESNEMRHYKNGQLIDTQSHTYDTTLGKLVIGAEIDDDPYLDMEVAAAYVYNRSLSDSERQQVYQHLKTKYLGNQPPTASNDVATVDTGNSTTIDVLANDKDPDGSLNASSVTIESGPSNGTATVHANGSITYTNDGSNTTSDSLVYTVTDDQGANDTATVSVSVGDALLPVQDGLVAHYAADRSVAAATSGVVDSWADLSGQGNDLTASGDPLLVGDALNGKPIVGFEKGEFARRTQTLNGLPSGNSDRTVFLVTKYESTGFGGFGFGKAMDNQTFATIVDSNGDLMIQAWSSTRDKSSGVAGTGAGWLVQSAVLNSSQVTHYKNGTQIDQFTNKYNTTPERIVVGANLNEASVDMKVAEAMIYDQALSDAERQQIEDYLQDKYFGE